MFDSQDDLDRMDRVMEELEEERAGAPLYYAVDPVVGDEVSLAALRAAFGPDLRFAEQGWLVWIADVDVAAPAGFVHPPGDGFELAGGADRVVCERGGIIGVAAAFYPRASTIKAIATAIRRGDLSWPALRYVTLVADRFDEAGRRVERITGERCAFGRVDLGGAKVSMEAEACGGRRWWLVPEAS